MFNVVLLVKIESSATNMLLKHILIFAYILTLCCNVISEELTLSVEPGTVDCFYEKYLHDQVVGVDYQVISGGQGKLDITFYVQSPSGEKLAEDIKESDNTHSITVPESGIYAFCWDNSFSHISSKTVYFEIYVVDPLKELNDWKHNSNDFINDDLAADIHERIEHILEGIHTKLNNIRSFQTTLLHIEARDRMLAEQNFEYVNWWAMIQITVMIVVGVIQVILIRSLFEIDPRSKKSWLWWVRR